MGLNYGDVCTGIGAASVAWKDLDWNCVWFSEIEPFPCKVLKHHYSHVPNLGDMTKLSENKLFQESKIDVLVGGTPCFAKDTLILTKKGHIPIQHVTPGDYVLTHQHRWRKVLRRGSKQSETIIIKGQGAQITTTKNHRFYASTASNVWDNTLRQYRRKFSSLEWIEAHQMKNKFWVMPACVNETDLNYPKIKLVGNEREFKINDEISFWWLVGRWLWDGWTRISNRRSYVLIACGFHKQFDDILNAAGISFCVTKQRTAYRYQIANSSFAKWLREHFGAGAQHKYLPGFVFSLPKKYREALFKGYLSADGCKCKNGFKASTVSHKLSTSMAMLAVSIGYTVSISEHKNPLNAVIEQRVVNQSPILYITFYFNKSRSAFIKNGFMHGLVRHITETNKTETVYDLEIEEDHSYTANGIVVHNCQSFSIAGLRNGLDDERGNLALEYCRILIKKQPAWFVWENVPGVLSSWSDDPESKVYLNEPGRDTGFGIFEINPGNDRSGRNGSAADEREYDCTQTADFATLLEAFRECGYCVCYRVLDSQYYGVPQRRRRVFVVGYLGNDWRPPFAVLFERESLFRDYTKGKKKKEKTTGNTDESSSGDNKKRTIEQPALNDINSDKELDKELLENNTKVCPNNGLKCLSTAPNNPLAESTEKNVVLYDLIQISSPTNRSNPSFNDPSPTITKQNARGIAIVSVDCRNMIVNHDISGTIQSKSSSTGYSLNYINPVLINTFRMSAFGKYVQDGTVSTVQKRDHKSPTDLIIQPIPAPTEDQQDLLRRLTPLECERLQGFPDNYTRIPGCSDTVRYQAIGNSMTTFVMQWIGHRLDKVDKLLKELKK